VYRYVHERLLQGNPPTVREVQQAMGFAAVQTAREHLERLVAEGRLAKREGQARGYCLPESVGSELSRRKTLAAPRERSGGSVRWVPLLGRVAAGGLELAVEDPEGLVPFRARTSSEELFALRVRGESMIGVGILPGDIVVVRRQPTARSGEIVVALVDDEATVKTLRLRRGRILLQPENPSYEILQPTTCTILGKVIEVRRDLEVSRS
jgi:repressor LexA